MKRCFFECLSIILLLASCSDSEKKLSLDIQNRLQNPTIKYAINEFRRKLDTTKFELNSMEPDWVISTKLDSSLGDEAFDINVSNNKLVVTGGNGAGIMYGLSNLKEQFANGNTVIEPVQESPRFEFRALKFNLPWSSYRNGEALDLHRETCRDTVFWRSFLDMMAENRFNKLTLWNLHPFNYLVKTKKYPEANGFSDTEMKEWESFWHSLFKMAKDRGIETYLINWNIFVSPEFAKAHNVAEYSIDNEYFTEKGDTSPIIKDYMAESVREVIDKYPNLTGLGITLGEGMGGMTAEEREEWLLDGYIQGMRDASRKVKFIHRVPLSAGKGSGGSTSASVEQMTRRTLDTLSVAKGPINIELKFNWSHGLSTPYLAKVHGGELSDAYWNPMPENYRLAWMIRNEDVFVLRWGQPDFIRDHIKENGHPYVNGYFVGSETYIPAKDYITSLPNTSYRYAFDRQWMFYKTWGRLLYNPKTPDQVFIDAFDSRFPGYGKKLFESQSQVSRVPLIIATYWDATWDHTLYSEGFIGLASGGMKLLSIEQMIKKQPMDPEYMGIEEFLANGSKQIDGRTTPIQLADSINSFCSKALEDVEHIDTANNNDLLYEVSDIQTWAHLGIYFAEKLKAAVAYQQYLESENKDFLEQSIKDLEKATQHWHKVVEITSPIYDPMPLQHYEHNDNELFHWSKVGEEVQQELKWLKNELK